ncbi:unnamed protein product [Xylocopa violacea]|uniref:Uncharacterized protein n=1 Tax=Xylocopa violacea TaxID=135666 RepID=A0ABP1PG01_XYLVO
MLLFLFYLISIGRVTFVYISNNLINKVKARKERSREIEPKSDDKIDDKAEQRNVSEAHSNDASTVDPKPRPRIASFEKLNVILGDGLSSPKIRRKDSIRKRSVYEQTYSNTSGLAVPNMRKRSDVTDTVPIYPVPSKVISSEETANEILKFHTPKHAFAYCMDNKRRGKCVVLHQQHFNEGNGSYREGSEVDVKAIERTFGNLGFEVVVEDDRNYYDIIEMINNLCNEDHSDCDCICIIILSHGSSNDRIYSKDSSYPFLSIWKPFTDCRTLAGKPKLFFIQACRGAFVDEGFQGRSDTDGEDDTGYTIPTQADFLFGYSTVDGFYSFRDKKQGTWYIQTLCNVIDEFWTNTDLLRMLTITSRRVGFEYTSEHKNEIMNNKKQMPTVTTTLTRDLYFTPKNVS